MFCLGASVKRFEINTTTFDANGASASSEKVAQALGGAIHLEGCPLVLGPQVSFKMNYVRDASSALGGAIGAFGRSKLVAEFSPQFIANEASTVSGALARGGGLWIDGGRSLVSPGHVHRLKGAVFRENIVSGPNEQDECAKCTEFAMCFSTQGGCSTGVQWAPGFTWCKHDVISTCGSRCYPQSPCATDEGCAQCAFAAQCFELESGCGTGGRWSPGWETCEEVSACSWCFPQSSCASAKQVGGGGLYVGSAALIIGDVQIHNNLVRGSGAIAGAGIALKNEAQATLTRASFWSNCLEHANKQMNAHSGASSTGALHIHCDSQSIVTVDRCTMSEDFTRLVEYWWITVLKAKLTIVDSKLRSARPRTGLSISILRAVMAQKNPALYDANCGTGGHAKRHQVSRRCRDELLS